MKRTYTGFYFRIGDVRYEYELPFTVDIPADYNEFTMTYAAKKYRKYLWDNLEDILAPFLNHAEESFGLIGGKDEE